MTSTQASDDTISMQASDDMTSTQTSDDMTSTQASQEPFRYHLSEGDSSVFVKAVDPKYDELFQALLYGTDIEIFEEVLKIQEIYDRVNDSVFKTLAGEIKQLCSVRTDSVLRHCDRDDLVSFSFKRVAEEWQEKAPTFHRFIITASKNPQREHINIRKKAETLLPSQVSAGCKLLNLYNKDMKAMQRINDLIFLKGGMKKSGFNRMQATSDCHSYRATIDLADNLAEKWNTDLVMWQDRIREEEEIERQLLQQISYIQDTIELCMSAATSVTELVLEMSAIESELKLHRKRMHPEYYFTGDNVDMITKVRQMTVSNQNKDQHMYQICAYQNRVSGNDLDDSHPLQDAATAPFGQLIPGGEERESMMQNFTFLTAKRWCKLIPYFAPYENVIPQYIEHSHIKETQNRTVRVNVGVLKKNESKNEDMADICKFMHEYVPGHDPCSDTAPVKTLSGGDYLTFERHKQAQMSVRDDETPSLRLEGLIPKMEEFHNQAEFFKVIWKNLYSTVSPRDIGTMFAARNVTNAKNVTADPSGNYYACALMADKFTDAYIVAGALNHFGMDSLNSEPKFNTYSGHIGNSNEMKDYIFEQARCFVENNVSIDVCSLPEYGLQSNSLTCRYCGKAYKQVARLRKHENKAHGHEDPMFSDNMPNNSKSTTTKDKDMVLNYTKLTLTLGLLRLNHNDAIAMGDGERIMLINQYLVLLYKGNSCPKYAYGMLETICQSKILLSERQAHRLKWNRSVNHRGKKDTNHPNDLDVEHCNKIFKDEAHSFRGIFTEKTVSRVSRSALSTYLAVKNFDRQSNVHEASGVHFDADLSQDIDLIVNQLIQNEVFKCIPGRSHEAFQVVSPNPFSELDMESMRDWISSSLKKYSAKHFY